MSSRMKVALQDIRYIQTQIQKILAINQNNRLHSQKKQPQSNRSRLMRDTFSSSFKSNNSQRPSTSRKSNSQSNSVSPEFRTKKSVSAKSQEVKDKNKSTSKSKSKSKSKGKTGKQKQIPDAQYIEEMSIFINSPVKMTKQLPSIAEQRPRSILKIQEKEEQKEKLKKQNNISNQDNSPEALQQKRAFFQQLGQKSQKPNKNTDSPNNKSKDTQKQLQQKISNPKQQKQRQINKVTIPPEIIKDQTDTFSKRKQSIGSKSIICEAKKQQLPYYRNHKNYIPIRTDEEYLQKKYKQKKSQKVKKQELKQKYKLLDQRLNRLRGQMHILPLIDIKLTQQQRKKLQLKQRYKQSLRQYLRYSPLNKLIKSNQKLKTQFYQSQTQRLKLKSPKSKPMNALYESGRPLWSRI